MKQFLWGLLAMASAVASLLFLRYGKMTRERLFLYFSAAFLAMALNWLGLAIIEPDNEHRHVAYLLRLLAFVLILVGIIDKNVRAARGADQPR
jgi:type II secretory pathway component PulM